MKNAKRIICLLLTLVMVLSAFTGCGSKKAQKGESGDGKIRVGLPYSASNPDINQNELVKYIFLMNLKVSRRIKGRTYNF